MGSVQCGTEPSQPLLLLSLDIIPFEYFLPSIGEAHTDKRLRKWFGTYNYLDANLPEPHTIIQSLARSAFIGFVASVVSDTVSNSLRVVKTYRQVNETRIGYIEAARAVIAVDGWVGLFGRGLKTRILANGLQGLMFSVLWKFFMDLCVI